MNHAPDGDPVAWVIMAAVILLLVFFVWSCAVII
jgi:hypothetical protein